MKLTVDPFDITSMKPDRIIFVIGKRGTGKSLLLEDILYHLASRFDIPIGMTPTLSSFKMFQRHFPPAYLFDKGLEKSELEKLLLIMKALVDVGKVRHALVVTDDCMADKKLYKGPIIRDIFLNGRHYWLTYVTALQYCMDLERDLRSQIDYVFCLAETNTGNLKRLYENFYSIFASFADFCKVFDKVTQNNGALVLDNTKANGDISSKLGWYRVPWYRSMINENGEKVDDPTCFPKFKLGRSIFYYLSEQYAAQLNKSEVLEILKPRSMEGLGKEKSNALTNIADINNPQVEVVEVKQDPHTQQKHEEEIVGLLEKFPTQFRGVKDDDNDDDSDSDRDRDRKHKSMKSSKHSKSSRSGRNDYEKDKSSFKPLFNIKF